MKPQFLGAVALLLATALARAEQPTIELDGPSETPQALFVQELLETAYGNLGYRVAYRKVPLGRSFVEANAGRLDGLRARVGNAADQYPNLIKVPFNLLDFKVVLLADRRVCGACLIEHMDSVATIRGFKAFNDLLDKHQWRLHVSQVTDLVQAEHLLKTGKVQGAVMSDTNVPAEYYQLDHHWIKHTLAVLPDYHYLNEKHRDLVPKLMEQFQALQEAGVVTGLRQKYNIPPLREAAVTFPIEQVSAVSGNWRDYTSEDNDTYWRILKGIFQGVELTTRVANWKRAKQVFAADQADILVGAYDFEVDKHKLRSSFHLYYEWPVVAFGKSAEILEQQIRGEVSGSACYNLGYDFNKWLPDSVKIYEVSEYADCLTLFEAGRVDMLLDYEADLPEAFRAGHAKYEVAEGRPLFLVFHDNAKGRALKSAFEEGFKKLLLTNTLADFYPNLEEYRQANLLRSGASRN